MQSLKMFALAVAVLAAVACGKDEAKNQKLTDPQIAAVLGSLDQSEINLAQGVQPLLQDDGTQRFAQMMIDEHTSSKQQTSQLVSQQGINPEAGPLSQAIERNAAGLNDVFHDPETMEIDVGYADSQVQMHQQALTMIDCAIVPDVSNGALKSRITDQVRPMIATHLGTATDLARAEKMGTPGDGTSTDGGTADGGSVFLPLGQGAVGAAVDCSNLCTRFTEGGPLLEEYRLTLCK